MTRSVTPGPYHPPTKLTLACTTCRVIVSLPPDDATVVHGLDYSVLLFRHDACPESSQELTLGMQQLLLAAAVRVPTDWTCSTGEMERAGRALPLWGPGEAEDYKRHLAIVDDEHMFAALVAGARP